MTNLDSHRAMPHFFADQSVEKAAQDEYNRYKFAEGIARSIRSLPPKSCYVFGLHGPWGDGKTSVLNFVADIFRVQGWVKPVEFNPWRIGSEDALFAEFFKSIASARGISEGTNSADRRQRLVQYAAAVRAWSPIISPAITMISPRLGVFAKWITEVAGVSDWLAAIKGPTLEERHTALSESLKSLERPVVIFIDDIDRLDAHEAATLFRLVKACATLPNIIYVLAFDREVVGSMLGKAMFDSVPGAGERYLQKIVQIPLSLPKASAGDLRKACAKGVDGIVSGMNLRIDQADLQRWDQAYATGLARRIRTPRHVCQYLNAIRFAVPLLANEVNTVDILLIEGLRVFYPDAFEIVKANQSAFVGRRVGDQELYLGTPSLPELIAAARESLSPSDQDGLDGLLNVIFPKYNAGRPTSVGPEDLKEWSRQRRACSPSYGGRFFTYAIVKSDVADADADAIVGEASNPHTTQLGAMLGSQLDHIKQPMLLEKIRERSEQLDPAAAGRIAIALSEMSDRFEEPFSLHQSSHTGLTAAKLSAALCARSQNESEQIATASAVLRCDKDYWFAAKFMRELDPPDTAPEKRALQVTGATLERMRSLFIDKYRDFSRLGTPQLDLGRRWIFEMLFVVSQAGGRKHIEERLVGHMQGNLRTVIRCLQLCTQPAAATGESIPAPRDFEFPHLTPLARLVNLDTVAKIISETWPRSKEIHTPLDWPNMTADDRILAQFMHFYREASAKAQGGTS